MKPKTRIGVLLEKAMRQKDQDTTAAAKELEVSYELVTKWRSGSRPPNKKYYDRLAKYLGMTIENVVLAANSPSGDSCTESSLSLSTNLLPLLQLIVECKLQELSSQDLMFLVDQDKRLNLTPELIRLLLMQRKSS